MALEALRGEQTVAQLAARRGRPPDHDQCLEEAGRRGDGYGVLRQGGSGQSRLRERVSTSTSSMPGSANWWWRGFLASGLRALSVGARRQMIEPDHPRLPLRHGPRRTVAILRTRAGSTRQRGAHPEFFLDVLHRVFDTMQISLQKSPAWLTMIARPPSHRSVQTRDVRADQHRGW